MSAEEFNGNPHGDGLAGQLSDWVNDHIRTVLLGPSLVALLVVFIYPAVMLLWLSLQNTRGLGETFEPGYNYGRIFTDPTFWNAVEKTLIYSFGSLFLSVGAGLIIALALNKVMDTRVRNIYSTLILISWAVPLSIVGVTWRWMFNGQLGIVNKVLIDLGILNSSYSWLGNSLSAMWWSSSQTRGHASRSQRSCCSLDCSPSPRRCTTRRKSTGRRRSRRSGT